MADASTRGDPDRDAPRRRALLLLALLAAALSFGRHLPLLAAPFDEGLEATNSVRYFGEFSRSWLEGGFLALAGRPLRSSLPTTPISGATYANHPPLAAWLYHGPVLLFGRHEWTLRLVPALLTALFTGLLVRFACRELGRWGGAAALLMALAAPMLTHFGRMAGFEIPLLPLAMVMLLAAGSRRRGALGLLFVASYLAAWIDWPALFFLPGVYLAAGEERWRRLTAAAAGVGLGFSSYLALLLVWEGGRAFELLARAVTISQGGDPDVKGDLLGNQADFVARLWGLLPLLALLLCLPGILRRLRRGEAGAMDRMVAAVTIATVLNVLAFRGRAINHEYWTYYLAPAVIGAGAQVVARLATRRRALAALALVLLLVEAPFGLSRQLELTGTGNSLLEAAEINDFADEDTLVIMGHFRGNWVFYVRAWVFDEMSDESRGRTIVADFFEGRFRSRRLAVVLDRSIDRTRPEVPRELVAAGGVRLDSDLDSVFLFERR